MYYTVFYDHHSQEGVSVVDRVFDSYDKLCVYVYTELSQFVEYNYRVQKISYLPGIVRIRALAAGCTILTTEVACMVAYTHKNKNLDISVLYSHGKELEYERRLARYAPRVKGYEYRKTSVPGIHKRKNWSYFKKLKTTAERKQVCGRIKEEGEPVFRGKRRKLPSAWDDHPRDFQRCWKAQHKGRKSWDK